MNESVTGYGTLQEENAKMITSNNMLLIYIEFFVPL